MKGSRGWLLITSDPLLVDQQSDIVPFIVLKLLLSHSDTVVDVGRTVGFVLTGYSIIRWCTLRDAKVKISHTVRHLGTCLNVTDT